MSAWPAAAVAAAGLGSFLLARAVLRRLPTEEAPGPTVWLACDGLCPRLTTAHENHGDGTATCLTCGTARLTPPDPRQEC